MKRTLFLLLFLFSFYSFAHGETVPVAPYLPAQRSEAAKNAPVTVQYPHEKMKVARGAASIFLIGQVNLPGPVTLDINGENVPVRENGAFIAFLPVKSGEFEFLLTASNAKETVQAARHIIVPGADIKDFTAKAEFDPEEVFPQTPVELVPGDVVGLSVRGTPGAEVSFTLSGLKDAKNIPMKEDVSSPGMYRAKYLIDLEQKPKTAKVTYKMEKGPNDTEAKIIAPAKIKVLNLKDPFTRAQVLAPGVKLRKIPTPRENLYPFYRAYGDVLLNGRMNGQYRIALNENESAWLEENKLKTALFAGYEPNRISSLRTSSSEDKTRLAFTGKRPGPISVHEFNDRMELTLYYVEGFDENYSFDTTSPIVDSITWSQPARDTLLFKIYFKKNAALWGHAYNFEGNDLVLDLMHQPVLTPEKNAPLKGARILIDAGHSPRRAVPYDGAVGPTGYLEYEANLALAEELKPLLEKDGATVIMTRQGKNRMSLQNRYEHALKEKAHLFISLHYNALPETVNPLTRARGYSVYYNYPHSFQLAQSVYDAFTRNVPLPDNGMIANDVLFIPRIPQMPSILVENAYIILPEQEEMAKSKEGRAAFVQALYEGILNFYGVKTDPVKKPARRNAFKKPGRNVLIPHK